MKNLRFKPDWPLPTYIFIPGKNPHPKKEGGHMEGLKDPLAEPIEEGMAYANDFLRYSIDLFNEGYYWECHVYLEALWNAHDRTGAIADFLKALIKLCACGVKENINQSYHAQEHLKSAENLILNIQKQGFEKILGFVLMDLVSQMQNSRSIKKMEITLSPLWK